MIEQALVLWIVGVIATLGTRHDKTRIHLRAIHCTRCHSRRTMLRWVALAIVVFSVLVLSREVHAPDMAFLALALLQEIGE